jgi:hypothetical protein
LGNFIHRLSQSNRDIDLIAARQRPDAHLDSLVPSVQGGGHRFLGPQFDASDIR